MGRPLDIYRRIGLVAGDDAFPVVGGFAAVAGPGDSTFVLFGLSLPTAALRFHRVTDGFAAGYRVRLRFLDADSALVAEVERSEQVRVGTFQETGRTEESLVFQEAVPLLPGRYVVAVEARDSIGSRGFEAVDTLDVPAFGADGLAAVVVYEAGGRGARSDMPDLLLNPRRTVAFGAGSPRVYVEAYGDVALSRLEITDAAGTILLARPIGLGASAATLRSHVVEIPVDSLVLGRQTIRALSDDGLRSAPVPLLVTISDQWMVANFDEVLEFLAYIASRSELDTLRAAATPAERRQAWEAFWKRRDPVPASPVNEYRDEFFGRVRTAAEQFAEPGVPGWKSARGRVFIVLGPPSRVAHLQLEQRDISGALDAVQWVYQTRGAARLELVFLDRDGIGRYELTRNSELAFRAFTDRLRAPAD